MSRAHSTIAEKEVPPLVAGDTLTWKEFERRWDAMPEVKFAELIGGKVFMPPPLSAPHGDTDNDVAVWLGTYAVKTLGCKASSQSTVRMLGDAPQPDIHLRIRPEYGGSSHSRQVRCRPA